MFGDAGGEKNKTTIHTLLSTVSIATLNRILEPMEKCNNP